MINHVGGNPAITNLTLASHLTEYSYAFGKHTKKLLIQPRNFKDIRIALQPGETDTNYLSLVSGSPYWEDNIIGPVTFYFKAESQDNIVVEILEWQSKD